MRLLTTKPTRTPPLRTILTYTSSCTYRALGHRLSLLEEDNCTSRYSWHCHTRTRALTHTHTRALAHTHEHSRTRARTHVHTLISYMSHRNISFYDQNFCWGIESQPRMPGSIKIRVGHRNNDGFISQFTITSKGKALSGSFRTGSKFGAYSCL